MKRLLLLRHGKSDWNKMGQEDAERTLAPRGRKASRRIAQWIVTHNFVPEVALISTARRTQETWKNMSEVFADEVSAINREALYLASPGDILEEIATIKDNHSTAMIVGHNPGLESLCHLLSGPGTDPAAMDNLRRGFPTAALAIFELAGDCWSDLSADGARMVEFVRPRELD